MKKEYNLDKRTLVFGREIVIFCKNIEQNIITIPLIKQLIRSGTSIGANYAEANGASSKKDFRNKIYICKKESQETKYWLNIISTAVPSKNEEIKKLWQEAQELTLIFQKITNSLRSS